MLISDFINEIRYKVGDTKKTKWDDTRIISLINEGQADLAKKLDIKIIDITLPIVPYQRELFINDSNFLRLKRFRLNKRNVKIATFNEIDLVDRWEEETGPKLKVVLYDLQNSGKLTLYPLLDETIVDYNQFNSATGVMVDVPNVSRDNIDGIITSVDLSNNIIIPQNVYDPTQTSTDGGLVSIQDLFALAEIKYSALPNKIRDITDTLDVSDQYINTLRYYVAGMLLFDDTRAEGVSKGQLFIQKYNEEVQNDTNNDATSFQTLVGLEINYRTGF